MARDRKKAKLIDLELQVKRLTNEKVELERRHFRLVAHIRYIESQYDLVAKNSVNTKSGSGWGSSFSSNSTSTSTFNSCVLYEQGHSQQLQYQNHQTADNQNNIIIASTIVDYDYDGDNNNIDNSGNIRTDDDTMMHIYQGDNVNVNSVEGLEEEKKEEVKEEEVVKVKDEEEEEDTCVSDISIGVGSLVDWFDIGGAFL